MRRRHRAAAAKVGCTASPSKRNAQVCHRYASACTTDIAAGCEGAPKVLGRLTCARSQQIFKDLRGAQTFWQDIWYEFATPECRRVLLPARGSGFRLFRGAHEICDQVRCFEAGGKGSTIQGKGSVLTHTQAICFACQTQSAICRLRRGWYLGQIPAGAAPPSKKWCSSNHRYQILLLLLLQYAIVCVRNRGPGRRPPRLLRDGLGLGDH